MNGTSTGSAPAGALLYSYKPTTRTLNTILNLTPGAHYRLAVAFDKGVQPVTLTPDASGPYEASDQGVLSFVLEMNSEPPVPDAPAGL